MALLPPAASHAIAHYGYGAVALAVGIESVGVPFPGETALVAAAIYAGTTHRLSILLVIAAAAFGAIVGDNIGFWLGREFGFRLLLRYGHAIRMNERRIKLGQYLFRRHGGKVVFFGRFVAILRALAAFLAGANRMTWPRFLLFNAAGGIVWATLYGGGAYLLGKQIDRLRGPVGIAVLIVVLVVLVAWFIYLRRNEARLEDVAEQALPGPSPPHSQAGCKELGDEVRGGVAPHRRAASCTMPAARSGAAPRSTPPPAPASDAARRCTRASGSAAASRASVRSGTGASRVAVTSP
jgi:membrane protein DedA with SNARE-associated domain